MSSATTATWMGNVLPRLTAASGIGYLATAYTVSRWLTRRGHSRPVLPPLPDGVHVDSVECRTVDSLTLRGWVLHPPKVRATVALFHGLRANRAHLLDRAWFLLDAGYRCVAFDHRADGESDGTQTSFGYFESRDVQAIAAYTRERWPGVPMGALGVSMGAAALCFAGRQFEAYVLESLYCDLKSAFERRLGEDYPSWLGLFQSGITWMTERRLGLQLADVAPVNHIADLAPSPVLLVTGSEDQFASPADLACLRSRFGMECPMQVIQGAGHEDVCAIGGEGYRSTVLQFFAKNL